MGGETTKASGVAGSSTSTLVAKSRGIVILFNNVDITGKTITVVVGTKVTLTVQPLAVAGAIPPLEGHGTGWIIPGETVHDYTTTKNSAVRTNLEWADVKSTTVSFYWIAGGTRDVSVTATVVGAAPDTAKTTFAVLAPKVNSMTSTTRKVAISQGGSPMPGALEGLAGPYLHFGGVDFNAGIDWRFEATTPAGVKGQLGGTQTVIVHRERLSTDGKKEVLSSGGATWLDMSVPFSNGVRDSTTSIDASSTATASSYDSPRTMMFDPDNKVLYQNVAVKDVFRIYFMFKPSGPDTIWVTLGTLDWWWSGTAMRLPKPALGAPAWDDHDWLLTTSDAATDPSGHASNDLPTWSAYCQSHITWVPVP